MTTDEMQTKIQSVVEKGMRWLTSSSIYCENGNELGGVKSKYDPVTKSYEVWKEGKTDALCTSGFIEIALCAESAFGIKKYEDKIHKSVNHLISLWDDEKGLMWAGLDSSWIYPLWAAQTANVLYDYFDRYKHNESKLIANNIVDWLITIQNKDGSIPKNQVWHGKIKEYPVTSWNSWVITAFLRASENGNRKALRSAIHLGKWVDEAQLKDGSYYYQYKSYKSMKRNIKDIKKHGFSSILQMALMNTIWKHPTSQVMSLFSMLELYKKTNEEWIMKNAQKNYDWITMNLSPRNIMYEEYYEKTHSVQEDIYPTAIFLLSNLQLFEITNEKKYLDYATMLGDTLMTFQNNSSDSDYDGSFPGVPLHPTEGEKAYTWDTVGTLISLTKLAKHIN